jgi:hypothetical protein
MGLGLSIGGAELAALAGIAAIGGFMRGFAGFATTLFMVPLFSLILEPASAVLIGLTLDSLAAAPLFPNAARQANWRSILPLLLGGIVVIPLGTYLLMVTAVPVMRVVIAAVVIVSALLMLSGWTYEGRKTPMLSFLVGGIAGTMGTATGIGGPPVAVYLLAIGIPATELRASLNAYSFVRMSIAASAIAVAGSFGRDVLVTIVLLLPVMLFFTWVGSRTFGGVSEQAFRRSLLIVLIVIGVALVVRALAGGI